MEAMYIIYRVIVGALALLCVCSIFKEKSLSKAISIGMVSIPLILRTLMIK